MNYETKEIIKYLNYSKVDFEYLKEIIRDNQNHPVKVQADIILNYFETMLIDIKEPFIKEMAVRSLVKVDWIYIAKVMKMDLLIS
jgi:hypothetical protein